MDGSGMGSQLYQGAANAPVELIPNPDFVFPMRDPSAENASNGPDTSSSTPRWPRAVQGMSSAKRMSGHRMSINALPEFSFNPSGLSPAASPSASISGPPSPQPSTPTTPRLVGHRRGGSEFIGGDSRSGGIGLLSSSPSKGDGILPPPIPTNSTLQPGPPPGRRGHAHRRSGAISSHDLSAILQPTDANASGRGGSAPTTPMETDVNTWPRHSANKSISYPSLRSSMEESASDQDDASGSRRPPSRARVGFSDRVEYIRPLSTISSETESSMSTVRGHSVSNSLSSVISAGAPSPPSSRMVRPMLNTTFEGNGPASRPKTAGAILDKSMKPKEAFGVTFFGPQRPTSSNALASPISPVTLGSPMVRQPAKKRNFFNLNNRRAQTSAENLTSTSEPSLVPSVSDSPPVSPIEEPAQDASSCKAPKDKKRARKVKSWTNPFGSKKPKSQTSRAPDQMERSPTPPLPSPPLEPPLDDMDLEDLSANFDVDNTVTIVTPTTESVPRPTLQTDFASWKPKHMAPADSDSRSPIIDLDLAMGPFEQPKRGRIPGSRDFASARRTMHSSGFPGGLFPPSLSHRRTESAPALVPFVLRKVSSTSAMADVFEEEEEDEESSSRPSGGSPKRQQPPATESTDSESDEDEKQESEDEDSSMGVQVVDSDLKEGSHMAWNFDDSGLGIEKDYNQERSRGRVPDTPYSPFSRPTDSLNGSDPIEVVEDYEEPRTSSLTRSSDSTVTPIMEEPPKEIQPPMRLAVPLPQQTAMTPETIASSSFPSPDFRFRQNSFEAPRLGTASSVAETRTINSLILGEPGPELRVSVDDVPSLTSSRSTMTSALQYGNLPLFSPRNPGERTASISSTQSAMSERRHKRTSIASLSRLVGSSFGERSKLHIEQRPQSEHMDLNNLKKTKEKKTRRLSKLMQFWRSSSYSSK